MLTLYRSVKLPKSFVAINLSEKVPDAFLDDNDVDVRLPPPALDD
jgi:hypothetical protein